MVVDVAPPILTLRPPDLENLAGQSDEDTGHAHLSYSAISTLLACQRRWGWRYAERLELISTPAPLSMGKAFHYGLQEADPVAGANLLDRPTDDQVDYDRLLKEKAIVACAVKAYLDRWGAESHREFEYRIRLRSPYTGAYSRTYDLLGYADGVTDHGAYLELAEDKLKSSIDRESVRRVALDRQVALASYALWRVTGKPVRMIRYRFVRKPSIKQRQGESTGAFIERLEADYVQRRDDFYLHEEQTFRSDADLLQTECELWEWAEQLRSARHRSVYARNTDSCGQFGGCSFLPLCLGEDGARALYRQTNENRQETTTE
jgi:hypothetical protein